MLQIIQLFQLILFFFMFGNICFLKFWSAALLLASVCRISESHIHESLLANHFFPPNGIKLSVVDLNLKDFLREACRILEIGFKICFGQGFSLESYSNIIVAINRTFHWFHEIEFRMIRFNLSSVNVILCNWQHDLRCYGLLWRHSIVAQSDTQALKF